MANAPESESKLLLQAYSKSRDARARERLVQSYSPLVRRICRRFRGSVESQEDLFQVGVIGLLSAIDKCDPERGPSFASLAIPEVLGSILNYLRDHGSIIKVPRGLRRNKITVERVSDGLVRLLGHWPSASELALASGLTEAQVDATRVLARTAPPRSLDAPHPSEDGDSASLSDFVGWEDDRLDRSLDRITLSAALETLPLREKTIVRLRFHNGMSQSQIANQIGISQMHVSRLLRSAL